MIIWAEIVIVNICWCRTPTENIQGESLTFTNISTQNFWSYKNQFFSLSFLSDLSRLKIFRLWTTQLWNLQYWVRQFRKFETAISFHSWRIGKKEKGKKYFIWRRESTNEIYVRVKHSPYIQDQKFKKCDLPRAEI